MSSVEISKDQKACIVDKVKAYFFDELDYEIGGFEAEFLIDFIAKEVEPFFYNRGLLDAQAIFSEKLNEAGYLIEELEKPTD